MAQYFDIEVSLLGVEPRIWRRFLIAREATFEDLHRAIQWACGWEEAHLFEFRDGTGRETIAKMSLDDGFEDRSAPNAEIAKLFSHFSKRIRTCLYVYDFGDNWEHLVEVQDIVRLPETFKRRLLDGARAFPPEDCGGIWGYEDCCRAVGVTDSDTSELGDDVEEMSERKEWLGNWTPEAFDVDAAKKQFDL